ncbi:hypothetical protein D9758_012146 [Tetrapyrgos nigripes]|uniref:Uncharacterized protein n=1 Tax=Tetrapyrgos nigripes TaxID=182062 RepID=A0A8H5CLZ9_9AGAR|nr:hypothetical protein D9758_012146 [Tetrapyrgos nigripes]
MGIIPSFLNGEHTEKDYPMDEYDRLIHPRYVSSHNLEEYGIFCEHAIAPTAVKLDNSYILVCSKQKSCGYHVSLTQIYRTELHYRSMLAQAEADNEPVCGEEWWEDTDVFVEDESIIHFGYPSPEPPPA